MSINILSGRFARRKLLVPKGTHIRPSTGQLRAALCNILCHRPVPLAGARVLDLFAGSGSLGFELLSSGAAHVDFVENHPLSIAALRHNQHALQVQAETTLYTEDVFPFLSRAATQKRPYTFIFADPPYVNVNSSQDPTHSPTHPPLARLLSFFDRASHLLEPGGLIIFEQAQRDPTPFHATHLRCIDQRTYGDSKLLFWEHA